MQFETIREFYNFSSKCICGKDLVTQFTYSGFLDDDYTFIGATRTYEYIVKTDTFVFPYTLEARSVPYGRIEFEILINSTSTSFNIVTKSTDSKDLYPPIDIVIKHFNRDNQKTMNTSIHRVCSAHCHSRYVLSTKWIEFDIQNRKMMPLDLLMETFILADNNKEYTFSTNMQEGTTIITSFADNPGTNIFIEMSADKFLKYPRAREFMINKLKTLLLFS